MDKSFSDKDVMSSEILIVINLFEGGAIKYLDWMFIVNHASVAELIEIETYAVGSSFKGLKKVLGMLQSNQNYVISKFGVCMVLCRFSRTSSGVELKSFLRYDVYLDSLII